MRHHERQFAHTHVAMLKDTRAARILRLVGVLDGANDLKMTRQDAPHQMFAPALQSLGQQCVVGVGQTLAGQSDGVVHR